MALLIPTVTARVAFTTDPFETPVWTDLSSRVRQVSIKRGRRDVMAPHEAGTCRIRFSNGDRQLDPEYTAGDFYGDMKPNRRVQVSAGYLGLVLRNNPAAYWRLGESSGTSAADSSGNSETGTYANSPTLAQTGRIPGDTAVKFNESYAGLVRALGPTSYWRLSESSGTTATDQLAAHNGTYINTPTLGATGRITGNTAVTFNGTDEYVTMGDLSIGELSSFTYVLWFKTTNATAAIRCMFTEQNATTDGDTRIGLELGANHRPGFRFVDNDGTVKTVSAPAGAYNDDAWHSVIGVNDAGTMRLYVDGATIGTPTAIPAGAVTLDVSSIAARFRTTASNFFPGTIDEVAVFPTALTAADAAALHALGASGAADGTGAERVTTPNLGLLPTPSFSYTGWFKTTNTVAINKAVFSEGNTASANGNARIYLNTSFRPAFTIINDAGTTVTIAASSGAYNDGNWHHIAGTVDSGNNMRLYVDGALVAGPTSGPGGTSTVNASSIGSYRRSTTSNYWIGTLDEVSVYPVTLTDAEIALLYQEGTSGHGDGYLFSGYIDSWSQDYWQNADAVAVMQATDGFKVLNKRRLAASPWEVQLRSHIDTTTDHWWRLGEISGATNVYDAIGDFHSNPNQETEADLGQTGLIAQDSDSAATLDGDEDRIYLGLGDAITGAPYTFGAWIQAELPPDDGAYIIFEQYDVASDRLWEVGVNLDSGDITLVVLAAGTDGCATTVLPQLFDGKPHFIAVVDDNTNTHIYVDGVDYTTGGTGDTCSDFGAVIAQIGNETYSPLHIIEILFPGTRLAFGWPGTVDDPFVLNGQALTAGQVLTLYQSGKGGFDGAWGMDRTDERVERVLDLVDWPSGERDISAGQSTMLPASLGTSALQHLQACEQTENGRLFMSRDGQVTFKNRHVYITDTLYLNSQATFSDDPSGWTTDDDTGDKPYSDIAFELNENEWVGRVRIVAPTQPAQEAEDAVALLETADATLEREILEVSPLRMRDAAWWFLGRRKDPHQLCPSLSLKPRRAKKNLFPTIFRLDLGYRVTVERTPQGIGSAISHEQLIEGEEHEIDCGAKRDWRVTYWLSTAETRRYWRIGNAVDGKIGTTTRVAW